MSTQKYTKRRRELSENVGTGYVVSAFDAMQQTNDSSAPFIQEANFHYLTGIDEPGWMLIVQAAGESVLVAPDVSEIHRIFDGGLSNEEARAVSGIDKTVTKNEGDALLKDMLESEEKVGVLCPDLHEEHYSFSLNPAPKQLCDQVKSLAKEAVDIRTLLTRMRNLKDGEEIEHIRRAVDATCSAFEQAKESLQSAKYEYNLDALFTYTFRNQGFIHAYEPIVASGVNACTLHYQKNNTPLPKDGLILVDIGARFDGYAADITRTFAIGTPSEREIAVHAAVEKAHFEIIALIKPGFSIETYHDRADEIMKDALKSLNLLNTPDDYRKYFPHAISHGLGLDVHESFGGYEKFQPGMVLTVEPGIYIPEEGIGVRIEDDILVTEKGHENLSSALSTSL